MLRFGYLSRLILIILITKTYSAHYHCSSLEISNATILVCDGSTGTSLCSTSFQSGLFISGFPITLDSRHEKISVGHHAVHHSIWSYNPVVDGNQFNFGGPNVNTHFATVTARHETIVTVKQSVISCGEVKWKSIFYILEEESVKKLFWESKDFKEKLAQEETKKIVWKQGDFHTWYSEGCAFTGMNAYKTAKDVDLFRCNALCFGDNKCQFYILIDGDCHLIEASKSITARDMNIKCVPNAICGWKDEQGYETAHEWQNGNKGVDDWWAGGCSWNGSVIDSITGYNNCGEQCRKWEISRRCTHYNYFGEGDDKWTCVYLTDVEQKNPDRSEISCGYLDRGRNGVPGRGSTLCMV